MLYKQYQYIKEVECLLPLQVFLEAAGTRTHVIDKFTKFEQTNSMSSTLKQELLDKIAATDDENLLQHLKEEIDYFTAEGKTTVLDELSPKDFLELETLLKEPFGHETESYDDFKKATQRWRTK